MDTAAAALVGFTMVAPATMAGATMAEAIMAAEDANAAEKEVGELSKQHRTVSGNVALCLAP